MKDKSYIIIFAHGSGTGREKVFAISMSPKPYGFGFATLLVDLLTPDEQESDILNQKITSKIPALF